MRNVILHHHFFKNAGSTLIASLAREMKNDFMEYHPSGASKGIFGADDLATLLNANQNLKAISSHHLAGGDYNRHPSLRSDYRFFDFILVRHPLKRLMSMYHYYQSLEPSNHPIVSAAQTLSLVEFLNYLIRQHPNHAVNPQANALSRGATMTPFGKPLELAIERLVSCTVFGTVDRYHDAMIVAEYFVMPMFPNLQLHYSIVNASSASTGYDGTLESIEGLVGHNLYKTLVELNELDIELCKAADDELARRKLQIPHYTGLVESFSLRCNALRN